MSAIETLGQEAGQVAKAAAAPTHAGAAKDVEEKGGKGASATHLALMIGEDRYLVELAEAGEIVPMPSASIMQVPLTRDWFLGVVNVRGASCALHGRKLHAAVQGIASSDAVPLADFQCHAGGEPDAGPAQRCGHDGGSGETDYRQALAVRAVP